MTQVSWLLVASVLAGDPPPLQADRPTVDLGTVPAHKLLAHTFQLKNAGAAPLTIGAGAGH